MCQHCCGYVLNVLSCTTMFSVTFVFTSWQHWNSTNPADVGDADSVPFRVPWTSSGLHWSVSLYLFLSLCHTQPPSLSLFPCPYQDLCECAHLAVKWKSLMAPIPVSKNSPSLPSLLSPPRIYRRIESHKIWQFRYIIWVKLSIIALARSYFFKLRVVFFPVLFFQTVMH